MQVRLRFAGFLNFFKFWSKHAQYFNAVFFKNKKETKMVLYLNKYLKNLILAVNLWTLTSCVGVEDINKDKPDSNSAPQNPAIKAHPEKNPNEKPKSGQIQAHLILGDTLNEYSVNLDLSGLDISESASHNLWLRKSLK